MSFQKSYRIPSNDKSNLIDQKYQLYNIFSWKKKQNMTKYLSPPIPTSNDFDQVSFWTCFFRWCFTLLPWDSSPWLSAAFGVEIFVGSRGFFHPHIFFAQQIQGGPLRVMEVKSSFLPIQSHPFFWVVATQIFFIFTADPWGRWTQFDEHIFQMGWFNHQPVLDIKKNTFFIPLTGSMGCDW